MFCEKAEFKKYIYFAKKWCFLFYRSLTLNCRAVKKIIPLRSTFINNIMYNERHYKEIYIHRLVMYIVKKCANMKDVFFCVQCAAISKEVSKLFSLLLCICIVGSWCRQSEYLCVLYNILKGVCRFLWLCIARALCIHFLEKAHLFQLLNLLSAKTVHSSIIIHKMYFTFIHVPVPANIIIFLRSSKTFELMLHLKWVQQLYTSCL